MRATPVEYKDVVQRKSDQNLLVLRNRYRQKFESLDPLEKEYLYIIEAEIQRRGLHAQVTLGQTIDRKTFIIKRLEKRNYPAQITLDSNATVRFVPTIDAFVLEAGKEKITRRLSDSADFKYLLDLVASAKTVSWSEPEEKKENKKEQPPLEIPKEKLRSTLIPFVQPKPLTEFFGVPKTETGADQRLKMAREFQEKADAIITRIYAEIYSFKPLGRMTELGEALGAEPPKGRAVNTPLGTFVFAKNRVPDNQTIEKLRIQYAESERLSKASARYSSVFLKPQPNTVTGNFRVVEEGRYFREKGLLSPEEGQHLRELEQFWSSHPDLDREKGWGVYREGGKIELPTPMSEFPSKSPSEDIKGYWGKSPRGLTAFWVEVYVNGKIRVRGHRELRQETPESLAKELQETLRNAIGDAGLPVTALLTKRTRLAEELLANVPEDVLPRTEGTEVKSIGSDFVHDQWIKEGWKPIVDVPRLETALKRPGTGGNSSPEIALEQAKKQYNPEKYEFQVVSHYALDWRFPYTVFVRPKLESLAEKSVHFKLTDMVFSEMENVVKDKTRKQNEFDICQAETTFLAEVGHCGDKNAKAIGRFLVRPVFPEEMRNLAAKFEVACIAEPDKPLIQCFDPQSGQIVKERKL